MMYSIFGANVSGWVPTGFTILDGLLGWSIKQVVAFLFPSQTSSAAQSEEV